MWGGRYEQESFLSCSTAFQAIMNIFFIKKRFIGYYTRFGQEMKELVGCYGSCDKKKIKSSKKKKAHIFMFKSWEKSMSLRYYIDAFFILIISIGMQLYIIDFSTTGTSYYNILDDFYAKKARAEDTSLSPSDSAQAKADFAEIENEYLDINNRA